MTTLEVVLLLIVLAWAFGFLGPMVFPVIPATPLIHLLIAVALVILIVRLVRGRGV